MMKTTYFSAVTFGACILLLGSTPSWAGARDRIIDPETAYLEQRQAYLENYQAYNKDMEEGQRRVLENFNSRHREYLEIDMPGPELYFPHDD